MKDLSYYQAITRFLGQVDGYILNWEPTGCQLVSDKYRKLLTCTYEEAIWKCEVIGPHTKHRFSDHLIVHERVGNGYSCASVGNITIKTKEEE